MIELHRVSKVYSVGPVKVPALREVSFRINKGEFVVLTGPSGAGKTTLLRLLYRDDLPSEGDVEVLGANLVGLGRSQVAALRRSIGVVFQDSKLLPVRTVYENVAFVLRVLGTPQRAALARAIVRRPPLLLADEPTGNLDEAMAAEIVAVLKDIGAGGTTIVLATHQARLAATLRRRTLTLGGGRVMKDEG